MKKRNKKLDESIKDAIYRNDLTVIQSWQSADSINSVDKDGRSAIFFAVFAGSETMVNQLMFSSPDLNLQDKLGWTPLHYAAQRSLTRIAEVLIDNGANINAKDIYGNNVLWRAVYEFNGDGEMIVMLLSKGADQHEKNNYGMSPYAMANTITNTNVRQFFTS